MYYNMMTSFRDVDRKALQQFKVEARRRNKTLGEALSEAMALYASKPSGKLDMSKIPIFEFPAGNEHLSEEIDEILYGKNAF